VKPPVPKDLGWRGYEGEGWWSNPHNSGDTPRRFAIYLFLLSLSSLFAASLIAYAFIRTTGPGAQAPIVLPRGLWASTTVLLLCGGAVALAQRAARAAQVPSVRRWLLLAWLLSVAFLAVQTPSLYRLVSTHRALEGASAYRAELLVVVLIVLHALHVIGGLIPLTALATRISRGVFTPAEISRLRSVAAYWHFLEAVWITMFATLLIVR